MVKELIPRKGLHVRTDLRAGTILCYEEQGGTLVPINAPCIPSSLAPGPGTEPWLTCNACQGTDAGQGRLKDVTCEVCNF